MSVEIIQRLNNQDDKIKDLYKRLDSNQDNIERMGSIIEKQAEMIQELELKS